MNLRTATLIATTGIIAATLIATIPKTYVHAQDATGGQALEIGPPVMNLSGDPGQTIKATISLRDVSKGSLVVTGEVNDFTAGGEDGTPKIILDAGASSPYSLKSWVSPLPQLTLKAREVKNLPFTITIPADASPGGYYGVIRFTGTAPELQGTGVSLSASLGALVLLKVNGVAKESLTVAQFFASNNGKPGTIFESAPINFVSRLKNEGNIHEQPAGVITITDMYNKTVVTLGVNQPPRDILPSSIRKFESSMDSTNIGNKILFGRYTAKLSVTYGSDSKVVTSSIDFWVIPYRLIGAGIAALIAAFFVLRHVIKRYNRHIIKKSRK